MTITEENIARTHGYELGDRVRLTDECGDTLSAAIVGDVGTVTDISGDLLAVEFDNGETTERFEWRFELAPSITVEDSKGLKALPVGTDLLLVNRPDLGVTIAENGGVTWNTDHSNSYRDIHGKPIYGGVELISRGHDWLPMTVANPEILGEFAPAVSGPQPGQVVEIIGDAISEDRRAGWPGLRAIIGINEGDNGAFCWLLPLTDRPDGFERGGFFWDTYDLLVLDTPFLVGDRVRVGEEGPKFEQGFEGHVVEISRRGGDDCFVEIDGRGKMSYRFTSLDLIASARQVEIAAKAEEEELAAEYAAGNFVKIVGNNGDNPAGLHQFEVGSAGVIEEYDTRYDVPTIIVRAKRRNKGYELTQWVLLDDVEVITEEEYEALTARPLVAGDQVNTVAQLDALPRGSVIYCTDDAESPRVKTGTLDDGRWVRVNRYYKGGESNPKRLAIATVYDETDKALRDLEGGHLFVAYVPA